MEKSLVIMAAGMGSRFGGLKQIEPVGPNKEIIADYSVYSAIKAGFNKIIFIIRKEHKDYFENNIINKYKNKIKVELAFQELTNIPEDAKVPSDRQKAWGTGHAIYSAKDYINGPFMVINADDFYGSDAFFKVSKFFDSNKNSKENIIISYPVSNTVKNDQEVKRGILKVQNGSITTIEECRIKRENDQYKAYRLQDDEEIEVLKDSLVSMNCFGFKKEYLDVLAEDYFDFFKQPLDEKMEFLLPESLKKSIKNGKIDLKNEVSNDKWMGITYKEDLEEFKNDLNKLIERGDYPSNLWN